MKQPTTIKFGLVFAAFAGVGLLYAMRGDESPPAPAVDVRFIDCICAGCQADCTISFDEFSSAALVSPSSDGGAGVAPRMGVISRPFRVLACARCGEKAVVAADRCPRHDKIFPRFTLNGGRRRCPECVASR